MSRIVLKERKFNPTNNDLGVFSSVDLETVEMRYKESDVVNDSEGNDGNKSKNHVPKPKDEDSIKPSFDNFKPPDSSGGGSGGSDNKKKDEDKGKEKVDLENIQEPDIESEDFSNNQDNQGNGESGTDSSSEEGGDSENQPSGGSSGEQMNGGNSSPIDNNKSKESEGEDDSGQGQNGSSQNNQNGNSDGNGEGGEDSEDDYGGDEDSENGSSQGASGNSQKSENEDNGSDLEGQGDDSGEQASQNSSDDSQQNDGSGNSQSGEEGNNSQEGNDGSQNNKPQNSKQEGESSNNSNSQNGQNGQGGQSEDSPDGDSGDVQQGEDGNGEGSDRLEGWDDEEDDYGEDSESELEKALKKAENSLSDLEKKEREKIEKEDKTKDNKPQQPKQLSDVEKKAAKDLIEDAIRSAKDKGNDENVEEMNDLLSKLDAHTLTSMVNVRGKGDWKHQLDKIFDQATGAEISINPNLVNKRIEDAPPGREDDTNQITHIAVLMDQSGSMGSHKFKTAISHVDTMLSVRKLGNVNFHIVGFAAKSLKDTAATYKKTKGRMLKKILLSEYANSGGGTHLTEAFQVLATKVRKVDAIMIFTDAEVYDGKTFNDNQMVMSYVKRNKRKIIWVLTHDESEARQKSKIMEFTPYSAKNKLYVRFKKSSS